MQTEQKMLINIPFMGFYSSWYDAEIDTIQEQESSSLEENQNEFPETERLAISDFADLFCHYTEYLDVCKEIAQKYVVFFNNYVKDECGVDLGLEFESMTSPREYNFQTDRIFAYIPIEIVQKLFDDVDKSRLSEVIRERFTSCSGFTSHYSNGIDDWLVKPVNEWDYNELCTLLIASLKLPEDWEFEIFQNMGDKEVFYIAFQDAMDWPKFEEAVADMRQEKREEGN